MTLKEKGIAAEYLCSTQTLDVKRKVNVEILLSLLLFFMVTKAVAVLKKLQLFIFCVDQGCLRTSDLLKHG